MRSLAASTISARRRRCAENVDAFCAIDCSSPMSVQTRSKRPIVAAVGGHVHPARGHRHRQPDQLERDGLAAHVRPRDDQDANVVVEPDRLRAPRARRAADAARRQSRRPRRRPAPARRRACGARSPRARRRGRGRRRRRVGRDLRRFAPAPATRARPGCARSRPLPARAARARGCSPRGSRAARRTASARVELVSCTMPWISPGELRLDRHDEAAVAHRHDRVLDRARVARRTHDRGRAVARVVLRLRACRGGCAPAPRDARSSTLPRSSIASVMRWTICGSARNGAQRSRSSGTSASASRTARAAAAAAASASAIARRSRAASGDAARRGRDRLVDVVDALHREPGVLRMSARISVVSPTSRRTSAKSVARLAGQRARLRLRRVRLPRIPLADALEVENLEPALVDQHDPRTFVSRTRHSVAAASAGSVRTPALVRRKAWSRTG